MDKFWMNFALEIGFFSLLGVLYYFYQKRKILRISDNTTPIVMTYFLQTCLSEKEDRPQPELDELIEALDDYLKDKSSTPPFTVLRKFAQSPECSEGLQAVIFEGLKEIEK